MEWKTRKWPVNGLQCLQGLLTMSVVCIALSQGMSRSMCFPFCFAVPCSGRQLVMGGTAAEALIIATGMVRPCLEAASQEMPNGASTAATH